MVPLIEAEVINRRRWLAQDEFLDLLTLAQSSPGPIAINTSVFIGYKGPGPEGSRGGFARGDPAVVPDHFLRFPNSLTAFLH